MHSFKDNLIVDFLFGQVHIKFGIWIVWSSSGSVYCLQMRNGIKYPTLEARVNAIDKVVQDL